MCCHVIVPPLLHLPLLEKRIIEIRNGKIWERHNLSELIKVPPRYDVVDIDGGAFLGGNGMLQKEVPNEVSKITAHNQTATNHTKILTKVYS